MTYQVYEVYQLPDYAARQKGHKFGTCLTSEYTREEAIEWAEAYYQNLDEEEGYSGYNEIMAILVTTIEDKETIETITLSWDTEEGFCPRAEYGTWNKASAGVK